MRYLFLWFMRNLQWQNFYNFSEVTQKNREKPCRKTCILIEQPRTWAAAPKLFSFELSEQTTLSSVFSILIFFLIELKIIWKSINLNIIFIPALMDLMGSKHLLKSNPYLEAISTMDASTKYINNKIQLCSARNWMIKIYNSKVYIFMHAGVIMYFQMVANSHV